MLTPPHLRRNTLTQLRQCIYDPFLVLHSFAFEAAQSPKA